MVIDIHIGKAHPLEALIQACHQVLFAAPISIGAWPHIISGFGGNHQLIPVCAEAFCQDTAKILLCCAGLRAVIIGQVKMGNPMVKCGLAHLEHIVKIAIRAKIMP